MTNSLSLKELLEKRSELQNQINFMNGGLPTRQGSQQIMSKEAEDHKEFMSSIKYIQDEALAVHAMCDRVDVPGKSEDGCALSISQRVEVMANTVEELIRYMSGGTDR